MAEKRPRSFANHAGFDPLFHFFAIPVFGISVIVTVVHFIMHPSLRAGWIFVVSVAALVSVFKIRVYALRNQDRTIRLVERLRPMTLLTEPLRSRIPELTEAQLIAIRFAGDAEVATCVESALAHKLSERTLRKRSRAGVRITGGFEVSKVRHHAQPLDLRPPGFN